MNIEKAEVSNLARKLIQSLDLDDYEDIESGRLVLTNPKTSEPTTAYIELASPEHQARKQLDLARTRKLRSEFSSTGKMPTNDPVDDIEDETEYLVAATLGWNLTVGGEPLLFSAAAARALYTDPKKQWVRAQALVGLHKTALFIKTSAKA